VLFRVNLGSVHIER